SFTHPAPPVISPLPLHDALPIWPPPASLRSAALPRGHAPRADLARVLRLPPDTSGRGRAGRERRARGRRQGLRRPRAALRPARRSEEHTSELQSLTNLVCRLLLE